MNPIRLMKLVARANKLVSLFENASKSVEANGGSMSKSLFASKVFWFNVLTAAVDLAGVLPIPQGYATAAVAVCNILLRFATDQPVHVVPKS